MSWATHAFNQAGNALGVHDAAGQAGSALGMGNGGFLSGDTWRGYGAHFDDQRRAQTRNMMGGGMYHAFDPQWSIRNPGTVGNPWALGRDAALPFMALGAGVLGPLGYAGAMGVGAADAGLTNAHYNRDQYLKRKGRADAQRTYNGDMSAAGISGVGGTIPGAAAARDVSGSYARNAMERSQAMRMYQNELMSQLQTFMSMGGNMMGGQGGGNSLLPFLSGGGQGYGQGGGY